MSTLPWTLSNPTLRELVQALLSERPTLYVVGGSVRDLLLGLDNQIADLDLIIEKDALSVARRMADRLGWAYYPLDATRDLARLVYPGEEGLICDISGLRGASLESDLRGRDFTINALALVLDEAWWSSGTARMVDVCGGQHDLATGVLRRVTDESLRNDSLRLLRAVRLAHQFDLLIEPATRAQVAELAGRITFGSPERIRDELWKVLALPAPDRPLDEMNVLGLLPHVLPEVAATREIAQSAPHQRDVYRHTLQTVHYAAHLRDWLADAPPGATSTLWEEWLAPWQAHLGAHMDVAVAGGRLRRSWLVWAALLHDVGKPASRTEEVGPDGQRRYRFIGHEEIGSHMAMKRLTDLRFSRDEIELISSVVGGHMRPHALHASFSGRTVSRRACYRFFRDLGQHRGQGQPGVGLDVLLLALADFQAIYELPSHAVDGYTASSADDAAEYGRHVSQLLSYAFEERTAIQQPLVNGHQLMSHFALSPGPQVGQILAQLTEAQAVGEITTQEEGLALAAALLSISS